MTGFRMAVVAAFVLITSTVLFAQPVTVLESRVYEAGGWPVQGTITITPSAPWTAGDGIRVEQVPTVVQVVNGAFVVTLEPTPTCLYYSAVWDLDNARPRREKWVVPAGLNPAGLKSVVVNSVPCNTGTSVFSWAGVTSGQWSGVSSTDWSGLIP